MKIVFTPTSGTPVTLGDDASKHCVQITEWSGQAMLQVEALLDAGFKKTIPRNNVVGQFGFTADKSHADLKAALNYFQTQYGYLNREGSLVLTEGFGTWTMALAHLTAVQRESQSGLRWWINYSFTIKAVT